MADCWRIILRVPKDVDDESALDPDWIFTRLQRSDPALERVPEVLMKDIYGVASAWPPVFRKAASSSPATARTSPTRAAE